MEITVSKMQFAAGRLYDLLNPPAKAQPVVPQSCREWAIESAEPTLRNPVSQLCTKKQFDEGEFKFWADEMKEKSRRHRKIWEFVFILQALKKYEMLQPSKRGLGFGVGQEPLPAVMAKYGAQVLATDLATEKAKSKGWVQSNQHAHTLVDLNSRKICDADAFSRLVSFEFSDMNNISKAYKDFDFCWSSCALEHLGSIGAGLQFIENSVRCLRPGGIAVHTTEYNCFSGDRTVRVGGTVIFRMKDFLKLGATLRSQGHKVSFNFNQGMDPVDLHVDVAPYSTDNHLKLRLMNYVTTSIGLIVEARE